MAGWEGSIYAVVLVAFIGDELLLLRLLLESLSFCFKSMNGLFVAGARGLNMRRRLDDPDS